MRSKLPSCPARAVLHHDPDHHLRAALDRGGRIHVIQRASAPAGITVVEHALIVSKAVACGVEAFLSASG